MGFCLCPCPLLAAGPWWISSLWTSVPYMIMSISWRGILQVLWEDMSEESNWAWHVYMFLCSPTSGLSSVPLHHSCAYFSQAIQSCFHAIRDTHLFFNHSIVDSPTSLVALWVKNQPAAQETQVWSLDWEDPLEEEMATHSSFPAWRIPWGEELGGLQPMGSQSQTRLSA